MRVWLAAAVLAFLVAGLVGSAAMVQGLEGPQLYVYSDLGVYPPGSSAVFRVLAINADGGPAAGVNVLATVYDPGSAEVDQFEGVTDGGGWFVFSVVLETEGFYMVSVQDVGGEYVGSGVSVLVCSGCPYDIVTTTVTSTITTSVGTVTYTLFTTITSPVTTTVYSTLYGTTVTETTTTALSGTLTTTIWSVRVVGTTFMATVFRTGTVTSYGTVSFTETVRELVVTTLVSTVVGFSDGGLIVAAFIAVGLIVLSAVLFLVRRRST